MNDSELLDALTRLLDAIKDADDQRSKTHIKPLGEPARQIYAIPPTLWEAILDAAQDARRVSH